jgi:hypothetical protein
MPEAAGVPTYRVRMMLGYFEDDIVTVLVPAEINDGLVMVAGVGSINNESIETLPRTGLVIRSGFEARPAATTYQTCFRLRSATTCRSTNNYERLLWMRLLPVAPD